jgi:hypothetical protein
MSEINPQADPDPFKTWRIKNESGPIYKHWAFRVGLLCLTLNFLFPPWEKPCGTGENYQIYYIPTEYAPIIEPPKFCSINLKTLIIQSLSIITVTGMILSFRIKP